MGVEIEGIRFPRNFLIQPAGANRPFYIDPFYADNILVEEDLRSWHEIWSIEQSFDECVQPSSTQSIVLRMCHNLFYAHKRLDQCEGMLRYLERMMILQPTVTELHRTRALFLGKMHRYSEAIDALELYMMCHPESPDMKDCPHTPLFLPQLAQE